MMICLTGWNEYNKTLMAIRNLKKTFSLPFDPLSRIYWTGVKMALPTAVLAVWYLHYNVSLHLSQLIIISIFIGFTLVLEFVIKKHIQYRLTPNIRSLEELSRSGEMPTPAQLQDTWVELMNMPVKIVFSVTFLVTLLAIVLPTAMFAYFYMGMATLAKHVILVGILIIVTLSMANLLLYERALNPLLAKIEETGEGQIDCNDERIIFVSTQMKTIAFFLGIVFLLALLIEVLVSQNVLTVLQHGRLTTAMVEQLKWRIITVSAVISGFGFIFMIFLILHHTRPLVLITSFMKRLGYGDINTQFFSAQAGAVRDEDNLLSEIFADMSRELNKTLSTIRQLGKDLNNQSDYVIQQSAIYNTLINSQNEIIGNISASLEESAAFSRRIASDANQIIAVMDENFEDLSEGQSTFQKVIDGVDNIYQSTDEKRHQMELLNEKLNEIEEVANVIRKLANQTQVIAFNAFIESADDEESDRFNNIADSVKRLTNQVTESAQEVRLLIQSVMETAKTSEEASVEEMKSIEKESFSSESFYAHLEKLVELINEMNTFVKQITLSTQKQERTNNKITEYLYNLNEIVTQNEKERSLVSTEINQLQETIRQFHHTMNSFFPANEL